MNAEPHTHTVDLHRYFRYIGKGSWQLTYGDQTVRVCMQYRTPSKRLVKRAFRKAKRRHDRGSVQAGDRQVFIADLQEQAKEWTG